MFIDLPLDQLQTFFPPRSEPPDFDSFWRDSLADARKFPLEARFERADFGLRALESFDLTYNGYGGQPIKGWLLLPAQRSGPLPCIVEYIGYGGGRGFPTDWLLWGSAGFAHLVMDTRGQGSVWRNGDTPDPELDGGNPQVPGFMSRGVLDPKTYYYRRVFVDAVRAVEAARAHPAVDASRIALTGGSQGGGITLAAGALADNISFIMPDVPFLCHFRRALEITDSMPYGELTKFLQIQRNRVDRVFETLSYFDGMNFAARTRVPALFSTALADDICPPSTVFAAYNHFGGPKEIRVWQFNHHEGGESYQNLEKIKFARSRWG